MVVPVSIQESLPSSFQASHTSLLQRGQHRDQFIRQQSIAKASNSRLRTALSRVNTKRLSVAAFTRSTSYFLAAKDHQLDDLLEEMAINSPVQLPQSEKQTLILHATFGIWFNRLQAQGFRQWKENTRNRIDLQALITAKVDFHEKVRQLLLAAETKRRIVENERQTSHFTTKDDKWMAANFSHAEMDLLLAWVRFTQPKTCRGVDDTNLREALRYLRFKQYQENEAIFHEGDKGDVFYLILDGNVGIYTANRQTDKPEMNLMGPRMFTYYTGESLGETALFTNAAVRTATAIAFAASNGKSVCELGELSRNVYSRTLKKFHQHFFTQSQRINFTQRLFLFQDWPRVRVVEVAEVLELRRMNFGNVLLLEGVSPLSHCFFVLSGSVTITTQLEINYEENCTKVCANAMKKSRTQMQIELHTVRVGEIVALESLLEDETSTARVSYSALGGSADVEVYAMTRSDGRAFLANSSADILRKIQALCVSERVKRDERKKVARRIFQDRESINKKHRIEAENETFERGITEKEQREQQKVEKREELNKISRQETCFRLQRPFLTHFDPVKLLISVDECKPVATADDLYNLRKELDVNTSLKKVAISPKMLSSLVKNFLVRDWETLEDDYSQRLTLQLPIRCSLLPLMNRTTYRTGNITTMSTHFHTARRRRPFTSTSVRNKDEHQTKEAHLRQISRNCDTKMYWDPEKKKFTLHSGKIAK